MPDAGLHHHKQALACPSATRTTALFLQCTISAVHLKAASDRARLPVGAALLAKRVYPPCFSFRRSLGNLCSISFFLVERAISVIHNACRLSAIALKNGARQLVIRSGCAVL
jgi:hypothetical protein